MEAIDELLRNFQLLAQSSGADIQEITEKIETILQKIDPIPLLLQILENSEPNIAKICIIILKNVLQSVDLEENPHNNENILKFLIQYFIRSDHNLKELLWDVIETIIPYVHDFTSLTEIFTNLFDQDDIFQASFIVLLIPVDFEPEKQINVQIKGLNSQNPIIITNLFKQIYRLTQIPNPISFLQTIQPHILSAFSFLIDSKNSNAYCSICELIICIINRINDSSPFEQLTNELIRVLKNDFDNSMKESTFDLFYKLIASANTTLPIETMIEYLTFSFEVTCSLYNPNLDFYNQTIESSRSFVLALYEIIGYANSLQFFQNIFPNFESQNEKLITVTALYINTLIDIHPSIINENLQNLLNLGILIEIDNENIRYYVLDMLHNVIINSISMEEASWADLVNYLFDFVCQTQNEFGANCICRIIQYHSENIDILPIIQTILQNEVTKSFLMIICSFIAYMSEKIEDIEPFYEYGNNIIQEIDVSMGSSVINLLIQTFPQHMIEKISEITELIQIQLQNEDTEVISSGILLFSSFYTSFGRNIPDLLEIVLSYSFLILNDLLERTSTENGYIVNIQLIENETEALSIVLNDHLAQILEINFEIFKALINLTLNNLNHEELAVATSRLAKIILIDLENRFEEYYLNNLERNEFLGIKTQLIKAVIDALTEQTEIEYDQICEILYEVFQQNPSTEFYDILRIDLIHTLIMRSNSITEPPTKIILFLSYIIRNSPTDSSVLDESFISFIRNLVNSIDIKKCIYLEILSAFVDFNGFDITYYSTGINIAIELIQNNCIFYKNAIKFLKIVAAKNKFADVDIPNLISLISTIDQLNDIDKDSIALICFMVIIKSGYLAPIEVIFTIFNNIPPKNTETESIPIYFLYLSAFQLYTDNADVMKSYFDSMTRLLLFIPIEILFQRVDPKIVSFLINRYKEFPIDSINDDNTRNQILKIISLFEK